MTDLREVVCRCLMAVTGSAPTHTRQSALSRQVQGDLLRSRVERE